MPIATIPIMDSKIIWTSLFWLAVPAVVTGLKKPVKSSCPNYVAHVPINLCVNFSSPGLLLGVPYRRPGEPDRLSDAPRPYHHCQR